MTELTLTEALDVNGGASTGEAVAGALGVAAICWAAPIAVVASPAVALGAAVAGAGFVINMVTSKK